MSRRLSLSLLTFFSILGVADSAYLAEHALTDTALYCGTGSLSGCNAVAQSAYSHLFGIPLGIYGLVFYAVILVVSLVLRYRLVRRLTQLLMIASTLGFALSLYFIGLQVFVIDAMCVYCIASFLFATAIFALAILFARSRLEPLPPVM